MQVKAPSLLELYFELNHVEFTEPLGKEHFFRGYQKLDTALVAEARTIGDFSLTLEDMNYTSIKLGNLKKHYFSEAELIKFNKQKEKAFKAKQASIFFSTVGESKGDHKKDHCIRGVGVNYRGKSVVNVHVFYRSSELSRKFLADLIFFTQFLFPKLEIPNNVPCYLHFTCGYVHAKQFPNFLIMLSKKDCYGYLDDLVDEWGNSKYKDQVIKNLKEVIQGKIPGFGMIRATNKLLQQEYEFNKILKEYTNKLIKQK